MKSCYPRIRTWDYKCLTGESISRQGVLEIPVQENAQLATWVIRGWAISLVQFVMLVMFSTPAASVVGLTGTYMYIVTADLLTGVILFSTWQLVSGFPEALGIGARWSVRTRTLLKDILVSLPFGVLSSNLIIVASVSSLTIAPITAQSVAATVTCAFFVVSCTVIQEKHGRFVSGGIRWLIGLRVVRLVGWVPLGAVGGFLLGLGVVTFWARLGAPEIVQNNTWLIIVSSAAVLGLINFLSVITPRAKGFGYSRETVAYSKLLELLGKKESAFLEHQGTAQQPSVFLMDADVTRKEIEETIPWATVTGALLVFIWASYLPDVLLGSVTIGLQELVSLLVVSSGLAWPMIAIGLTYRKHGQWKNLWNNLWSTVYLLSLSDSRLAVEYTERLITDTWADSSHGLDAQDMTEFIEKVQTEYGIRDQIPSEFDELNRLYINSVNYNIVRTLLDSPHVGANQNLLDIASNLVKGMASLTEGESRASIARAHLFLALTEQKQLPPEIFEDLKTMLVPTTNGNAAVEELASDTLDGLLTSEESAIPDSVKRMVTIYPVLMWFATVLLLMMGLAG